MLAGLLLVALSMEGRSAELSENVALGAPVKASAPTWGSLSPATLTDGNPATFTHPIAGSGTLGYYFEIDLGRAHALDRVLIRNRNDGCCVDRLTRYAVELYADAQGEPGRLNWSADVRADGSNSGVGGIDTIRASSNPTGIFTGRFLRIVNRSGLGYSPQVAEVEVYGAPPPVIRSFTADEDVLSQGQSTVLSWDLANAAGARIDPGVGPVSASSGFATIQPSASTIYTLTATNAAGANTATVAIGVDVALSPPMLTEFMAANVRTLEDEDGDSSDWIELANPNAYGLRLEGYHLTDDPLVKAKWQLPNARIPAKGHLLVFASGKDRRDPAGELHTDFKLGAAGDYLALVDRDGATVLGQFPATYPATREYPPQLEDVSYGVAEGGMEGYFRPATPKAMNRSAYEGVVGEVRFGPGRGFYEGSATVTLTTSTPGAQIRYTLNGSAPTTNTGAIFTQPFVLTNTTVVRAIAHKPGWAPADVATHTYLFLSNVVKSTVMRTSITTHATYGPQMRAALRDLPSISLVTSAAVNGTSETPSSFEWIDPDGVRGTQAECGARLYGGAFTYFEKSSFRLYFRSEYGDAKLRYPLFEGFGNGIAPVDRFDQLELRNGSHDMRDRGFYMANIYTDDIMKEMGRLNPHGRFVHLYLNGNYWGVYHLRERWGASMHSEYLGGAKEDYESINGNWNVGGWADPGTPYDGDGSTWATLKQRRSNYKLAKELLDVPEFIDYMLMWMFGGSEDEYRCVGPAGPGSGFKFYLNDADGWFCGSYYCAAGDRTVRDSPGHKAGDGPGSLFSMLFAEGDPDYRALLADRIHAALFNNGPLTAPRNIARLDERCAQIERAFYAEAARWLYLHPSDWASRRDQVRRDWLPTRTAQALAQWRNAGFYPRLDAPTAASEEKPGGGRLVRILPPAGKTALYTLNGGDPRLPGGAISPEARTASGGANSETLIRAGASWRWFTDAAGLGASDLVAGHPNWSAANWKHPDFIDGGWRVGAAQLGFGEGDEATVIPSGNGTTPFISSYFRHAFNAQEPGEILSLTLHLKRDDGAIVYLNGVQIASSSMPAGVATGTTYGIADSDDGASFQVIPVSAAPLREGRNVIAVELHQTANTSDASFDLRLEAGRPAAGTTPPVIAQNAVLRTRAKDGADWSALNEQFFQVGETAVAPGDLVISELHYNPPGADDTEFLELLNRSSRAVNLRGARFTSGIRFSFPDNRDVLLVPGERLTLVKDLLRFQRLHGLAIRVGGVYFGNLNNAGEEVALSGPGGETLCSTRYAPANPWPAAANGGGQSLVLAFPWLGSSNPFAWRASVEPGGSPSSGDSSPLAGNPLADADQDGTPAVVEHALGTSDNDPLSGPGSVTTQITGDGMFTLTFPRRLAADDFRLVVESSSDLAQWGEASFLSSRPIGPGLVEETWGVPLEPAGARFVRLSLMANP